MEEGSSKTLRDIIIEAMDARGINMERLSELTELPERYLIALRDNDFSRLPPAPYIRGYFIKIGSVLNIDGIMLWEIYKNQNEVKRSGIEDKLPINRFVIKNWNKKIISLIAISAIGIVYLIWLGGDFIGVPKLEITNPPTNNMIVKESFIKVSGEINPNDKLTINGDEILVSGSGRFEKDVPLQGGVNAIEFKVKKLLGKEVKVIRNVIYQQ
jgi:hypothetical protein